MRKLKLKLKIQNPNTKTARYGSSCEWTEGESNPKSKLARVLPIPIGLGPHVHKTILAIYT